MRDTWSSESSVSDATTAILLGPIAREVIERECKNYQKGVLWITSPETKEDNGGGSTNLKLVHCSFPMETIREAVQEFLRTEYNHQPEV